VASGASSIGDGTSDCGVGRWGCTKSTRRSWKGGAAVEPVGEDGVCAPQLRVGLVRLQQHRRGAAGRASLDVELAKNQAALSARPPAPRACARLAHYHDEKAASVAAATPAAGRPRARGRRLCQRGCVIAVMDGCSPEVGAQGLYARYEVAETGQGIIDGIMMATQGHEPCCPLGGEGAGNGNAQP